MSDQLSAELFERVQRFLDGGNDVHHQKSVDAREALRRGMWQEQLARHVPSPNYRAWWPLGHRSKLSREHKRCVELALERTATEAETTTLEILPLWTGDNEDSEPGPHWFITHGVVVDGEVHAPWEISPVFDDAKLRFDVRLRVQVERWRVAHVIKVASYAPSVDLVFRGKHAGVIDGEVYKVCVVNPVPGEPRPRPTRHVPMFCQWFEPRVDSVEAELLKKLEARQITSEPSDE